LHSGGYVASAGTEAASTQSPLNVATQSTQATTPDMFVIDAAHELPCGTVTSGQLEGKPIVAGSRSSPPPHTWSGPPHALQMPFTFLNSALAIEPDATASGHGPLEDPKSTRVSHFWRERTSALKYFSVYLPIAR
jgi:hypothetical protein